jgi:cytidine deaminase
MQRKITEVEGALSEAVNQLAPLAWDVRARARVIGPTRVGCAVMASDGSIYVGCNVEHRFRSHDVHAEVNAITSMIANGQQKLVAVVIAAERERFTPCGACMDWIFEFGGGQCLVAFQAQRGGPLDTYRAEELMPFYPV